MVVGLRKDLVILPEIRTHALAEGVRRMMFQANQGEAPGYFQGCDAC